MRELDFARKRVVDAFEEIKENFEEEVERRIEGNTAEFLNGMLRVEASRQLGADLCLPLIPSALQYLHLP